MIANDFCKQFASFASLLSMRVAEHGDKTAITFLKDGDSVTNSCTYQELQTRVIDVASWLEKNVPPRSRVLLSFNPGLDFVYAFLGCLYAGVTAVPAYPPRRRGNLDRLESIAINAKVAVVLSANDILSDLGTFDSNPYFKTCPWKAIEGISGATENWVAPTIRQADLAFLQYTSGSTGLPKGVAVSHQNILHNLQVIKSLFGQKDGECVMGSWLPMYHDMGLIGSLLHPLSIGGALVFMPPMAFLQKPIRWLKMVTDFKATISGGPNFAYDLCVARTSPEERAALDLTSWQVAFNGSEPIRFETMQGFDAMFRPHGFSKSCFSPCYGMAETTLMVTGSGPHSPWQSIEVDSASLRNNIVVPIAPSTPRPAGTTVQHLVSSGCSHQDIEVQVVDPSTLYRCGDSEIGEIWVRSKSVAQGYWGLADLTDEVFHAKIKMPEGTNAKGNTQASDPDLYERQYLRTGDLGFRLNDELYITGRFKDLIILNGENHYPQDLEGTIEKCHPDLKVGQCVAFSWTSPENEINASSAIDEQGYAERVFVAQEINREAMRSYDFNEIVSAAYHACWEEHQVALDGFLLIRPGGIPKTTSGKLQRQPTRKLFENETLPVLASWRRDRDGAPVAKQELPKTTLVAQEPRNGMASEQLKLIHELELWIQTRVASYAGLPVDQVELNQPIAAYGLKSLSIVRLAGELSTKLGHTVSPTLAFDYPTIQGICRFLIAGETNHTNSEPSPLAASANSTTEDPIAIVGLACRLPGADSISDFNSLLNNATSMIRPWPESRNADAPTHAGSSKSSTAIGNGRIAGGFLSQIDQFDPLFFGISPREAEEMDPQQRLMLEVCHEAFEHAGISPQVNRRQRTGVFIGVSGNEYARTMLHAGSTVSGHTATGNSMAMVANRISYVYNFRGPSFAIDTACSSSLVAVHLAAESLLRNECDLAVVGGVSLQSSFDISQSLDAAGMLSPTGMSRAFAAGADGFVRGEGCGAVLLKRLSHAQRDGDRIFCLLRGSAVNQDGRSNGLTAPNGLAQQDVIRQALNRCGLKPNDIDYVEAHGTGTELGDPIEMGAIASVFVSPDSPRNHPLWIGSVKTNIGHLEGAAGIAGLIKTALALHHHQIPPHLHFNQPSPHIDWHPKLQIPTKLTPWPKRDSHVRRAGVSSFGFGGTNAHVILEETPSTLSAHLVNGNNSETPSDSNRSYWLKVSAKSNDALAELARRYAKAFTLRSHQQNDHAFELEHASLESISLTANVGKSDFNYRAVVGFKTREELVARLLEVADKAATSNSSAGILIGFTGEDPASPWPLAMKRYVQGEEIQWDRLYPNESTLRRTVSLPSYPFQRQRCWFRTEKLASSNTPDRQLRKQDAQAADVERTSPLLGSRLDVAGDAIIYEVDLNAFPSLADHRLRGESIFPAAGFLELALAAGKATFVGNIAVEDLQLEQTLRWSPGAPTRIQVVVQDETCRILSRQTEGWREHVRCRLVESRIEDPAEIQSPSPRNIPEAASQVDIDQHYARCASVGLQYSGAFRSLASLSAHDQQALGEVRLPTSLQGTPAGDLETCYGFHPALLDGCFQSIASLMGEEGALWLPVSVGRYRMLTDAEQPATAGSLRFVTKIESSTSADRRFAHLQLFGTNDLLLADIQNLQLKRVGSETPSPADPGHPITYETWLPRLRVTERSAPPEYTATELGSEVVKVRSKLVKESGYEIDLAARGVLDDLSVKWIVNAFIELFGPIQLGQSFIEADVLALAAIAPEKRSLFFRLMDILSEHGFLTRELKGWKVTKSFRVNDVAALSDATLTSHPRMAPEILLLRRCGQVLSDVVRGDVDPLPILFSDKSAGSALDVYTRAAGAQVLNGLLAEAASVLANRLAPGRTLRVLEIGAGTGATTRLLLRRLPKNRCAYTFTDIARGFLSAAKDEYQWEPSSQPDRTEGPYPLQPFVSLPLNIELEPLTQGFAAESYDVIVAANVLHATACLDETLSNVERLLAPGGQLLLLEGTRPVSWMDLTFGLTDGWWRFDGRDSTRSYALISPDRWREKLLRHGFTSTEVVDPNTLSIEARDCQSDPSRHGGGSDAVPAENVFMIATKASGRRDEGVRATLDDATLGDRAFLVIADEPTAAESVASQLRSHGSKCETIELASHDTFEVAQELQNFWSRVPAMCPDKTHIVFVVDESDFEPNGDSPATESLALVAQLVGVIQSVLINQSNNPGLFQSPRLTLAYRHRISTKTHQTDRSLKPSSFHSNGLRGVMRTLALENPQWQCRFIECEVCEQSDWRGIVDELRIVDHELDAEPEITIRQGIRYGRRLVPHSELTDHKTRNVLRIAERGDLESLRYEECDCQPVNAEEVEIEVHASGLNFRDVLNALGKYPGEVPLGSECAGIVRQVGNAVTGVAIGDRVVAIAPDSFATSVVAPVSCVFPMPAGLDFATAASLPVAYLTANVALKTLADLKPGQSVLIHAATGGVGLAALSLCKSIGANVFVTASASKQAYLYGMGLSQVYDSRTAGFAGQILNATQGRGVDVVLNLLDESFAEENLLALAQGGIYVDITKPSLELSRKIEKLRPDVVYQQFDLAELLKNDPATLKADCVELLSRVERGELSSLPIEVYESQCTSRAFRKMQRASHIGKIVISQSPTSDDSRTTGLASIRSDRAYVIVGGLGDIGLLTARILSESQAGLIALIGRSAPNPKQQAEIERLSRSGQSLMVLQADASDRNQLDAAMRKVREVHPIAGVIHSAGILSDAMLSEQSSASLAKVWHSKATIGWNLHQTTAHDPLELFVVYSSLAAVLGAPGQANHSAANAFLDGLVEFRIGKNLPGTSIDWGPWSEIGEAERRSVSSRNDLRGAGEVTPLFGAKVIELILKAPRTRLAVSPLSVELMPDRLKKQRLFDFLRRQTSIVSQPGSSLAAQLMQLPPSSRQEWMVDKVKQTLARILGIENKLEISSETTFVNLGLDSLTGIEFIDALNREWMTKLPTSAVYDHPTVLKITKSLILHLSPSSLQQAAEPLNGSETETNVNQGANSSDKGADEFDDKLAELLAELNQWA